MQILGYTLKMTCGACPEQYDVFDSEGKQVGYLRLRGGNFRVYYPDTGGELVFYHRFEDYPLMGMFSDDKEREFFLTEAVKAIHNHERRQNA